jgi:carbon monoxide dehydrogenase subunit G
VRPFIVTEILEAPRAAVFDVISDPGRRLEWQSSLRSVEVLTPGPARLGTRWREVTLGWIRFEMEITAFERPTRWCERGHGWLADATLDVTFEEVGHATRVSVEVDISFKGPFKLIAPAVRRLMPAALAADLRRVTARSAASARDFPGARA